MKLETWNMEQNGPRPVPASSEVPSGQGSLVIHMRVDNLRTHDIEVCPLPHSKFYGEIWLYHNKIVSFWQYFLDSRVVSCYNEYVVN